MTGAGKRAGVLPILVGAVPASAGGVLLAAMGWDRPRRAGVVQLGHYLGAEPRPEESLGRSSLPVLQLAAAFGLSVSPAVLLQCPRRIVALVAVNGAIGWAVFGS